MTSQPPNAPPPASYGGQPYGGQQPYGGPPPGPPGKPRLRGRIPLRLAMIFGVLGIALVVVGGIILAKGSFGKIDSFERVSFSAGSGTVHLTRTGNYVAYYETPSDASHRADIRMRLLDSGGTPVPLHLYGDNTHLTYDYDNKHGEAAFTFKISKAGDYQVQLASDSSVSGAKMAFGSSIARSLGLGVGLVIPGVLLIIAAIVLLIVGLVKRSNSKRELRNAAYPGAPPGPPGPSFGKQTDAGGYPGQRPPPSPDGGYQGYPGYPAQGQGYPGYPPPGQGYEQR